MSNKIINNLKVLNVKFENLEKNKTTDALWEGIFQNNLYKINRHMLEAYFNKSDFWKKSYTYISGAEKIKKYIDENINDFFNLLLEEVYENKDRDIITDDIPIIVEILNNNKIDFRFRRKYIEKLHTVINDINLISEKNLWDDLLHHKRVIADVNTIAEYFSYANNQMFNIDKANGHETLINFMCSIDNIEKLDFEAIEWEDYPGCKRDFYKLILSTEKFKKDISNIIGSAHGVEYELSEFSRTIEPEYVNIMIQNSLLAETESNCKTIISAYLNNCACNYINKNIDYVCELIERNAIELKKDFWDTVLIKNSGVSDEYKLRMMNKFKYYIPFRTMYPNDILFGIMDDHLSPRDVINMCEWYNTCRDKTVQKKILEVCRNRKDMYQFKTPLLNNCKEVHDILDNEGAFDNQVDEDRREEE